MEKIIPESFVIDQEREPRTQPLKRAGVFFDRHARLGMTCALILSDQLSLALAILIALPFQKFPGIVFGANYVGVLFLLGVTLTFSFARKGLYPAVGMNYVDELREIVSNTSFSFLIIIGVTFLLKTSQIYSRLLLLIAWALSLILIPAGRYAIRQAFIRLRLWGEPVAVIGSEQQGISLAEYFRINLQLGLRPAIVLQDDYFEGDKNHSGSGAVSIADIKEYANRLSLKTVLVVVNDLNSLDALVDRYRFAFERVMLVQKHNGRYGLNNLKSLDFSDVLGLQVMNNLLNFWSQLLKRLIDLLVVSFAMLILSPFFGLIVLLIWIDSPGSAFYRQQRLGRHGRAYHVLKFRTMYLNATQQFADALANDPALKKEWESHQKLRNDPRITRMGKFLRKFSLDEIPQFWNVLVGEMSLVGPRPIMLDQQKLYGEYLKDYVQVLPGITGLWQVSGRNETTFIRRAELDNEYIQRWSLWLDIYILVKTIKVVFWQQGAF